MVVLLVIVVLIILSLMFGGFQKGTKSGSLAPLCTTCTSALAKHAPARAVYGLDVRFRIRVAGPAVLPGCPVRMCTVGQGVAKRSGWMGALG